MTMDHLQVKARMADISKELMHLSNNAQGNSAEWDQILRAAAALDQTPKVRQNYFVNWNIDIVATSPREAATIARQMQSNPAANVFIVFDEDGNEEQISV